LENTSETILSHLIANFVTKNWGLVAAFFALVLLIIYLARYWVPSINQRLSGLEAESQDTKEVLRMTLVTKAELYDDDGTPRYQNFVGCEKTQNICQKTICLKMEEVKTHVDDRLRGVERKLGEMDQSRQDTRGEIKTMFDALHEQSKELVRVATHQAWGVRHQDQKNMISAIVDKVVAQIKTKVSKDKL